MYMCVCVGGGVLQPVPAAGGPAPFAAAVSPAAVQPCSSAQSELPAAALSGPTAGLSSSAAAAPSQLGYVACLHRHTQEGKINSQDKRYISKTPTV